MGNKHTRETNLSSSKTNHVPTNKQSNKISKPISRSHKKIIKKTPYKSNPPKSTVNKHRRLKKKRENLNEKEKKKKVETNDDLYLEIRDLLIDTSET